MKMMTNRCLLIVLAAGLLSAPAIAAEPEVRGALAYTDVMRFDYDRDGVMDRVQFWMEINGRPVAVPNAGGDEGTVRYFLYDLGRKEKIFNWILGYNMDAALVNEPKPITDLKISDRTATFKAFGLNWTIIDGGAGFAADELIVTDGVARRRGTIYSGDLCVGSNPCPLAAQGPI